MIRELKYSLIQDMEKGVDRLINGYQIDLCSIVDKIYYINSLTFEGTPSATHQVVQPIYCVTEETPPVVPVVGLPEITTLSLRNIKLTAGANLVMAEGIVTSEGTSPVTAKGFCWGTSPDPMIGDLNKTTEGEGLGIYSSSIMGLTPDTVYYIRAYAISSVGISYGVSLSITTLAALPVLINTLLDSALTTAVVIFATIASNGGSVITQSGICWDTDPNPTIFNDRTIGSASMGTFISTASNLIPNTNYYFRSYATNSAGTGYGPELNVATEDILRTLASLTSSSVASGFDFEVVQWFISLDRPAVTAVDIPCITTNSDNSGSTTSMISFSAGQQFSGGNTVNYNKYLNGTYTAYCDFGVMPEGYIAGEYASFVISEIIPANANRPSMGFTITEVLTPVSATMSASITNTGGADITSSGFCWSEEPNPTIDDNKISTPKLEVGGFLATITDLRSDTLYYVRAYCTNVMGITYSNKVTFYTMDKITANVVGSTVAGGPSYLAVQWTIALTHFTPIDIDIPYTITNATNTGTIEGVMSFLAGERFQSINLGYTKNLHAEYTAYCTIGELPAGFIAGAPGEYIIPISSAPQLTVPVVINTRIEDIMATTLTTSATISSTGGSNITTSGFCWSTSPEPTVLDNILPLNKLEVGEMRGTISGLIPETTYYLKAYATNAIGTGYTGQSLTITAQEVVVNVTSTMITSGTAYMVVEWTITLDNPAQHAVDINYSMTNSTNTGNVHGTVHFFEGQITTNFALGYTRNAEANYTATCVLENLPSGYIAGTTGSYVITKMDVTATSPILSPPLVADDVLPTSAFIRGSIVSTGGTPITSSGFCWATTENPTVLNSKISTGPLVPGPLELTISPLAPSTLYYVRAYATNNIGTSYSAQMGIMTMALITVNVTAGAIKGGPDFVTVQWTIALDVPTVNGVDIPYTVTNDTNTGTIDGVLHFPPGFQYNSVNIGYIRSVDNDYTATCVLHDLPSGYVVGTTEQYIVLKQ